MWLDLWLLSLIYRSEEYIISYRRATCVHDNSGKKRSPVYDSIALTEICEEYPSSHHVTVTGQQFCVGNARAEQ